MTTVLIIVAIVWIVGAVASYDVEFKQGGYDHPIWYAMFWPLVLILFGIHKIHNK